MLSPGFLEKISMFSPPIYVSLILLILFQCAVSAQPGAHTTRNVFIVAIDGIRNDEAFESGSLYLPFIWDSLRPRGAICTNFMNTGITVTNSGHSTLVTGVRQMLPNNSGIVTPIRPKEPTIGEYYRKYLSVSKEKVYYISGKNTIWRYPVSLYPGYGYDYSPTIVLTSSADTVTWDSARAVMERDHPSLCYVLFAQVDAMGHTADTTKYISAIRRVDSLIYLLWQKIQSDSAYANKTTMIVTSDHGRHDEGHGGWKDHGDYCHGCRHIPFLAVGPDTRPGTEISAVYDQIDIVPTVAELLGFKAPLAQGTVISEIISGSGGGLVEHKHAARPSEKNLSQSPGISRSAAIASSGRGLHVLYSDRTGGKYEVFYTRSSDFWDSWTQSRVLFTSEGGDDLEPALAAFGDSGLFAASVGLERFGADSTYAWVLRGRRSTDSGISWGSETRIETLTTISCKPSVSAWGSRISIVSMSGYRIVHNLSRDYGLTFDSSLVHGANSEMPSCAQIGPYCYALWHHLNNPALPYWNILCNHEPWTQSDIRVTTNDSNSYSYDPVIANDNDLYLHLVYSNLSNAYAGNLWKIQYRRNTNFGNVWSSAAEISGERTGFSPVVRVSDIGNVHAIWADYSDSGWSIWGTHSTDHGLTWAVPYGITTAQSFSSDPDFVVKEGRLYLAWQDLREGNWEIFFQKFAVPSLPSTYSLDVKAGWNMVSVPLNVQNYDKSALFPSAASGAFAFDGSAYALKDTLENGKGYWLKFASSQVLKMFGAGRPRDTLHLLPGWNLIGSISDTLIKSSIIQIPPGVVVSDYFGYEGAYSPSDLLVPGKGYWVKADDYGIIVLPAGNQAALEGGRK